MSERIGLTSRAKSTVSVVCEAWNVSHHFSELDEISLVKILVEPKNALTKQYQKLLSFDNVRLKFTDTALSAIARKAMQRKTGARGLRTILEEIMLDVMYEIPSQKGIKECLITEDTVTKNEKPLLLYEKQAESA